jgi:hypothetical protein
VEDDYADPDDDEFPGAAFDHVCWGLIALACFLSAQ